MELWQMDVVGGFLLADGTHAKALTGLDDHPRFCVSAFLMVRERQQRVCEGLALALRTYGVPQGILTDRLRWNRSTSGGRSALLDWHWCLSAQLLKAWRGGMDIHKERHP